MNLLPEGSIWLSGTITNATMRPMKMTAITNPTARAAIEMTSRRRSSSRCSRNDIFPPSSGSSGSSSGSTSGSTGGLEAGKGGVWLS
jgi:hypothetical protein